MKKMIIVCFQIYGGISHDIYELDYNLDKQENMSVNILSWADINEDLKKLSPS
jgi:hypothetical protein